MTNPSISLDGIEKAVSGLNYKNPNTSKYRLIHAIKNYYSETDVLKRLESIPPEALIPAIWNTEADPDQIRSKLKNLNSIKSSVNKDLINCFKKGTNPEGIIIGSEYVFDMSDEAKDQFIGSMSNALSAGGPVSIDQIAQISQQFGEFLTKIPEGDVLTFLSALIDSLKSDRPLPPEQIPEMLKLFGNLLTDIPDHELLKEQDKVRELVHNLAEKTGDSVIENVPAPEEETTDKAIEEIIDEDLAEDDADTEEALEEIDDNVEVVDVLVEDDDEAAGAEEEIDDDLEEAEDDGELEEIEEVIESVEDDETASDNVDAPFDSFMDDDLMLDNTLSDRERKRLLAERFDRYLGEMEKHYNQYLLVPGGEYIIGAQNARKNERPIQKITISDIFFGRFPVTNALFEVFVERTGYKTTAEECGFGIVYQGRFQKTKDEITGQKRYVWNATSLWEKREGAFWYQPFGPGTTLHRKRNHPVVQVSFRDAMAFASWVGKRLPSEAEWEAAARTALGDLYPWGNEWKDGVCNTEESEISDTVPVDNFPDAKNAFGLSDLLGNTLEWTADRWEGANGSGNHQDYHIVKGGSWVSNRDAKLHSRFKYLTDFTANILGFRCLAD